MNKLYVFLPFVLLTTTTRPLEFDFGEILGNLVSGEKKERPAQSMQAKMLELAQLKHEIKDSWLNYAQKMHYAKLALKRQILDAKFALKKQLLPKLIESNFSDAAIREAIRAKIAFSLASGEKFARLMHAFVKLAKEMHKKQKEQLKAFAQSVR